MSANAGQDSFATLEGVTETFALTKCGPDSFMNVNAAQVYAPLEVVTEGILLPDHILREINY